MCTECYLTWLANLYNHLTIWESGTLQKDGAKRENQNLFKGRQPYRAPEDPFENIEEIFL